ncbi:MAG: hypothetical protein LWW95_03450 [Candidatus Desulfofervidus auxilii]|nr:hypothetical protein [Candidatus Desulfofervidus auxilii]
MVEITFSAHVLFKALEFFDKILGSQEKRYLIFFSKDGLFLGGGDNFLNANLKLKSHITLLQNYTFPLDTLRLFLKDKLEQPVKIIFSNPLKFITLKEKLSIKTWPSSLSFIQTKNKYLGTISVKTLRRILDLGSIISEEGESIFLFLQKGYFGVLSENKKFISCAFTPFKTNFNATFSVQYTFLRRLIKALQFLSEKKIFLFLSSQNLIFLLPQLKINLGFSPINNDIFSLLHNIFTTHPLVRFKVNLKEFKKNLAKLARMHKYLTPIGNIIFESDNCIFKIVSSQGDYIINLPLKTSLSSPLIIDCHFPQLHSLCSRLNGKEINISFLPTGCLLKHGQFFCFIKKRPLSHLI